jgi:methionine-S-sulfoxide reductase
MRLADNNLLLLILFLALAYVSALTAAIPGNSRRAILVSIGDEGTLEQCTLALERRGFSVVIMTDQQGVSVDSDNTNDVVYRYSPATGMLRRSGGRNSPSWIPLEDPQENLLVQQGWSFLDVDESEPLSSFDIDAANVESTYKPKWGLSQDEIDNYQLSLFGWDVSPWTQARVQQAVDKNVKKKETVNVLLRGGTDLPGRKETNKGYSLKGATSEIPAGVFVSSVTGIPLFTTFELLPTTASAGWLSFAPKCLLDSHLQRLRPATDSADQRIEVVEAASGCHLGHFFDCDSYCINASCIDFIPALSLTQSGKVSCLRGPTSYRQWEKIDLLESASGRLLKKVVDNYKLKKCSRIVLGCGCFWSAEAALRRLPGVVDTTVGYAGGTAPNPTYEHVCSRERSDGYAEVVQVIFDPTILPLSTLLDCFLAMHDPTKVRAHGKHAPRTGQYRSCIFCPEQEQVIVAQEAIQECQASLKKAVCTQVASSVTFWKAEDRHQRYEENRKDRIIETETLSTTAWLDQYGRRKPSIVGSAQTLEESVAQSRFYI